MEVTLITQMIYYTNDIYVWNHAGDSFDNSWIQRFDTPSHHS